MIIARGSPRWTSRLFAQSARRTRSSRSWRSAQRRTYASDGGHGSQQSSMLAGDLPWYAHALKILPARAIELSLMMPYDSIFAMRTKC